jgi:hypothetical protein
MLRIGHVPGGNRSEIRVILELGAAKPLNTALTPDFETLVAIDARP